MLDLSMFNKSQRKALQILYESNRHLSLSDISKQGCSINLRDLDALCTDKYYNAVTRRGRLDNGEYLISSEGRGIYETLQKQQADEAYQRDYNAKALEVAQESNNIAQDAKDKAFWANVFSLAALFVSIAAIAVAIWAELRA